MQVSFEEDTLPLKRNSPLIKKSLTRTVMYRSRGLLQTEQQASVALLMFALLMLVATYFVVTTTIVKDEPEKLETLEDKIRRGAV